MKKILSFLLITIFCVLPLSACSTDLSGTVNGAMDSLFESLSEMTEPFLKQDDKYSSQTGSEINTDELGPTNSDTNKEPSADTSTDTNDGEAGAETPEYTVGTSVGEKLPSFSVQTFDEKGLSGNMIDATKTGKVTVINFWGIWCHFCLEELPAFSEVAGEYGDEICMVAIHSKDYFSSGAVTYVADHYIDSEIIFAKDVNNDGDYNDDCYDTFGGNGYYPYTVIIDENGIITYTVDGAISKATLVSQIEKALGN